MRFPAFDLPTADGGRLRREQLEGKPWFVYMARHPGCYVCQDHLSKALELRPQLRNLGGEIVVFFNSDLDYTRQWWRQSDLPRDLTVAIDPDALVYEEIGTIRGSLLAQVRHALGDMVAARGSIRKWKVSTRNDMLRMGADVARERDGEIALRHICRNPGDRKDPRAVIDALREPVAA